MDRGHGVPRTSERPAIRFSGHDKAVHEFMAWLPDAVFRHKLIHLVRTLDARVLQFDDFLIRIQVGQKAWVRRKYAARDLPVELTIRLRHATICPKSMTHVLTSFAILPGHASDAFRHRCAELLPIVLLSRLGCVRWR